MTERADQHKVFKSYSSVYKRWLKSNEEKGYLFASHKPCIWRDCLVKCPESEFQQFMKNCRDFDRDLEALGIISAHRMYIRQIKNINLRDNILGGFQWLKS